MKGNHVLVVCLILYYKIVSPKGSLLNYIRKSKTNLGPDLSKCRVTHSGIEYAGSVSQTKSGIICQQWETPDPIHEVAEAITDADFPEGSMKKAKNHCRNPRRWSGRPWCYTLSVDVEKEECDVPLCSKEVCRITGTGIEYAGQTHSVGRDQCVYWSNIIGHEYKAIMYNSLFPDGTRIKAGNKCRNPDSDVGGPWCYTSTQIGANVRRAKAYCDVPLCDPKPCMTVTAGISSSYEDFHTVFSLLSPNTTSIDFSVKIWSADQWNTDVLKLALTEYPLPAEGGQLRKQKTGFEVVISTYKSGITPEPGDEPDWYVEGGLLSGTEWRDLELSWAYDFVTLKIKNKTESIFTKDFTENKDNSSLATFNYYSIKGAGVMWNMPFCSSDSAIVEHVTTHGDFERRWPLPKTSTGYKLNFFVKGFHTAIIEMKRAAMLHYPSVQLTLSDRTRNNLTSLTWKKSADEDRISLEAVQGEPLSYWQWKEFLLKINGPRMELFFIKDSSEEELFRVIDYRFESIRYFSIGSRHSTIHWAIESKPPLDQLTIPAEPPECVTSGSEAEFIGSQSVSASGLPCLPWFDQTGLIPTNFLDTSFVDGSKEKAKNFCRNPTKSIRGPFCYVVDLKGSYRVTKEYCMPRRCRLEDCRLAGTGNDYMGSNSVTLSGRQCQRWTAKTPHTIPTTFLQKELFPELSLIDANNFCRNPSHDYAGLWCFTDDDAVSTDLCNIQDCNVMSACTVIVKGNFVGQSVFVLPSWRSKGLSFKIKSWDPRYTEGLLIVLRPAKNQTHYKMELGAGSNDKIILYYIDNNGTVKIVKKLTTGRVIPSGSWVELVLVLGIGEVNLHFLNNPLPFFHWKYTFSENVEPLNPRFLSYTTLSNKYSVGVAFDCDECHTHINEPGVVESIYPLNWWQPKTPRTNQTKLNLNVRGIGMFILILLQLEQSSYDSERIFLEINSTGQVVIKNKTSEMVNIRTSDLDLFNNKSWTNYTLSFTEERLKLTIKNETIIDYLSMKPLLFYFFTISVVHGILFWNANCHPLAIDSRPVNGGWSQWGPWQCSVTCGGGHGQRTRICNRPKPNIYGLPCNGSHMMEGKCNRFKCGDVPPDMLKTINTRIKKRAHNVRKHVGESLSVQCDSHILTELKNKAPKCKIEWSKNGVLLYQQTQKAIDIVPHNFSVEIPDVALNDSGIYICALESLKGKRAIIRLTTVTVVTEHYTKAVREGNSLILDCTADPISLLFTELTQFWTLNGTLYQDYGGSSHDLVDIDVLSPVRLDHEGEWQCMIVQVQYNLTWTTAWFRLHVKKNTVLSIMFDTEFIGHYFSPFGNHPIVNSITFFILLMIVFFIVTVCFVRTFKILRPSKSVLRKARDKKSFDKKFYQRLGNGIN